MYTENQIIKGCIKGERIYQKALFDKYSKAMVTLSYRILNDFELANESLHDALLYVFKNIVSFRQESTLGAWIRTIVVRTAYKRLKQKADFNNVRIDEVDYEIPVDVFIPIHADYLEKAILSLPDGFRTVFTLVAIEGYSHKQVAKDLNISEGTSKSQLYHAKKQLQKIINKIEAVKVQ